MTFRCWRILTSGRPCRTPGLSPTRNLSQRLATNPLASAVTRPVSRHLGEVVGLGRFLRVFGHLYGLRVYRDLAGESVLYFPHKNAARSDGSTLGELYECSCTHTIRTTGGAAVHGGGKTYPQGQ